MIVANHPNTDFSVRFWDYVDYEEAIDPDEVNLMILGLCKGSDDVWFRNSFVYTFVEQTFVNYDYQRNRWILKYLPTP
ncbi:MAG: hypothetical protein R3A45_03900 [Bdellovibrionota bacterium]